MRILLIEDDEILADRLVESLADQNYVVDWVVDGLMGLEYAQSASYDLILTDVGLPDLSGIALCERLRAAGSSVPILLMTAKDMPDERVRGLDAGADDHLTKPLNLEELQARVRALLRRGEVASTTLLEVGPLRLDPIRCQVTHAGTLLRLTPKEYNLLELFMRNPARVFSRGQIIEHLWNFDDPPLEESVKAHVKGLRRKLKQVDATEWIENVYGLGYRLNPDGGAPPLIDPMPLATPTAEASLEQDFQKAMTGLWQQYRELMTERVESLQKAAVAIQAGDLPEPLRQAAAQAAHKLAGVLGMFELDAGTAIARQIETLLEAESTSLESVPGLIDQLVSVVVDPTASPQPIEATLDLLLVSLDPDLVAALQPLIDAAGMSWTKTDTVTQARQILSQVLPGRVILDLDAGELKADSLALVQSLTARPVPVPIMALTSLDSWADRIALSQAGIQRLLNKSVTPAQVWATLIASQPNPTNRAQVLVVDDDPLVTAALRPLLEPWGMRVMALESPQHFWEVLSGVSPDLLILDVEMPHLSGIDLCQAVRTDPDWQNMPILFLTAHRDRTTVQRVFAAGADDFVTKPIVGPELLTRILNRLERTRLLQTLSIKDPLTGLSNYTQSRHDLEILMQEAVQGTAPLSFTLLRLREMLPLQERYGHDAVHAILQHWGYQIQTFLRTSDVAGYWGNGEVIIAQPGLTLAESTDYLAPLLHRLRQYILTLETGVRIQPEVAIAGVVFPHDGDSLPALYRVASDLLV